MERERIVIQDLKRQYDLRKEEDVLKVADLIVQKGYRFETREGMDFDDEIYERAKQIRERRKSQAGGSKARPVDIRNFDTDMQRAIRKQMKVRDVRRMVVLSLCFIVAFACIGFFVLYYYKADQSSQSNLDLAGKVKDTAKGQKSQTIKEEIYVDEHTGEEKTVILQVLEKYEELYNMNPNLIGWLKIADTNGEEVFIDYPVMQSPDKEYYLTHNFYQEYDKNGSIFLDPECDVVHRSTNLIIYGHHMKSGEMFGNLDRYSSEEFFENHRYIQFDTIYEKGTLTRSTLNHKH